MQNTKWAIFLALFMLVGCERTANLYSFEDGSVTTLHYTSGHGRGALFGVMPSGENIHGEYSVVSNASVGWGSVYSGLYSASAYTISSGGRLYGSAILTGEKGLVLDCEFMSGSGGHGTGACKDNRDRKYRLIF